MIALLSLTSAHIILILVNNIWFLITWGYDSFGSYIFINKNETFLLESNKYKIIEQNYYKGTAELVVFFFGSPVPLCPIETVRGFLFWAGGSPVL